MADLAQNEIGFGRRVGLIVVDMINGFTDPSCPLGSECASVVEANQRLLACFRAQELPIFFTSVTYENASQASVFREKLPALDALQAGSHWVAIDAALQRRDDETVINKHWASAFHATDLNTMLRANEIDSLVVTGLTTSGCVRATAVDGLQHNFRVTVAEDAVGDRNHAAHTANLFDLQAKYTDVITSNQIIERLN